jgi:hypothetical protein
MIVLKNRTKNPARMIVLNVDPKFSKMTITTQVTEEDSKGVRMKRILTRQIGTSIRILANGQSEPIEEAICESSEIKAALARRDIVKIAIEPVKAETLLEPKAEPARRNER